MDWSRLIAVARLVSLIDTVWWLVSDSTSLLATETHADRVNDRPPPAPHRSPRRPWSRGADGEQDLYWKPADMSAPEETIFEREGTENQITFSQDGKWMVYREGDRMRMNADAIE